MKQAKLVAGLAILIAAAAGTLALAREAPPRMPHPNGTAATSSVMVRPGANTLVRPPLTSVGVPLTQGECKNLGGKVQSDASCNSGNICTTVDSAGTIHRACVTNTVK